MRGDVSTSLSAPSSRLKQGIMSDGGFLCNRKEYAPLPDATSARHDGAAARNWETANCGFTDERAFFSVGSF